jgi:opacity protein-like surface antigen
MKLRLAAALLLASVPCGGAAEADMLTPGLYTVINYSGGYPDFKSFKGAPNYLDGVEGDIGWRLNRFYSIEASYSYYSGSTNNGQSLTTSLQTGAIDALGYLPFGRMSPWALYGDIGATEYFLSASTPTSNAHENHFGARAGGGIQYQFDENLGLRIGGRYEWADATHLRDLEVFSVGLVWQR